MVSTKFKNFVPSNLKFENENKSHHLLRIHFDVSINEFIYMLKQRFFKNDDDIGLEDIWVFRIIQNQNQQFLVNVSYDL
jgi:hypothetical protein